MKPKLISDIDVLIIESVKLKEFLQKIKGTTLSGLTNGRLLESFARLWFENTKTMVTYYLDSTNEDIILVDNLFEKLLNYSSKSSILKKSALKTVSDIHLHLRDKLKLTLIKETDDPIINSISNILNKCLDSEVEYLEEALKCARMNCYRASIVLGWSAAVDRIQKVMALNIGFDRFNQASTEMKSKTEGRYRRFSKSFSISTLSELRMTVFDNDLLWIAEYLGLFDGNQHDRLSICFTMRNNSGHPGEAKILLENLSSFYSDLNNIVFSNEVFNYKENVVVV